MDFDETVVGGERFTPDLEAIASEEQVAGGKLTGIVGGEGAVKLEGVAGEFDGGFQREAVGTEDLEAELSGVALGVERNSQERESEEQEAEVEQ